MKVMLRHMLHAASGGVKLTRVITLLDGSVGFNMAVKMFDNIALCFTTVSYGCKRLYNIKHRYHKRGASLLVFLKQPQLCRMKQSWGRIF